MNESEIKQIAINLIATDQITNPHLDYLSPSASCNKQPFLRQNFSLLQHSEALEIIKFLQDLTFIEIQKNMNIAFKQEPGHLRKYERIEIFIKLCHSQIYQKEH